MKTIDIYCDGSCRNKKTQRDGGWGAIIVHGFYPLNPTIMCGVAANATSNNRMELLAAICPLEILGAHDVPVVVTSDSKYVVDGFRFWIKDWEGNDWKVSNGDDLKNMDLWKRLLLQKRAHRNLTFKWVKGHRGHAFNEQADYWAGLARRGTVPDEYIVSSDS